MNTISKNYNHIHMNMYQDFVEEILTLKDSNTTYQIMSYIGTTTLNKIIAVEDNRLHEALLQYSVDLCDLSFLENMEAESVFTGDNELTKIDKTFSVLVCKESIYIVKKEKDINLIYKFI